MATYTYNEPLQTNEVRVNDLAQASITVYPHGRSQPAETMTLGDWVASCNRRSAASCPAGVIDADGALLSHSGIVWAEWRCDWDNAFDLQRINGLRNLPEVAFLFYSRDRSALVIGVGGAWAGNADEYGERFRELQGLLTPWGVVIDDRYADPAEVCEPFSANDYAYTPMLRGGGTMRLLTPNPRG